MDRLIEELAKSHVNPVLDIVIEKYMPGGESKDFYIKVLDIICVMALNMQCQQDMQLADAFAVHLAHKIKNLESGEKEWIN